MLSSIFELAPNALNEEVSEHEWLMRETARAYLNLRLACREATGNNARPKHRPSRLAIAAALREWSSLEP